MPELPSAAPPIVAELNRLLALRSGWIESRTAATTFSDADVLVLGFVSSELGAARLVVDDPELGQSLQRSGLEGYVQLRGRSDFWLDDAAAGAAGAEAIFCLDAHRPVSLAIVPQLASAPAIALYGLLQPGALQGARDVAAALGAYALFMAAGGRAGALWKTTLCLAAAAPSMIAIEQALARLDRLVTDRSLDPLHLAETCMRQQIRLRAKGEDELVQLRDKVEALETECIDLKTRLVAQQRSLLYYHGLLAPSQREPSPE